MSTKNLRIIFDSWDGLDTFIDACKENKELKSSMGTESVGDLFYSNPARRETCIHNVTLSQADLLLDISRKHGKLDFEIY